jgi:hypothetical protein
MKHSVILCALLAFTLQNAQAASLSALPKMKPGLIETSMTSNGNAMPPMRTCITEAQMKDSEKMSKDYESKNTCTDKKFRQSGNTYYMEMTCKDRNGKPMPVRTEVTVVSENEFRMKSDTVQDGKPMHMENTTKRVGDCTGKENAIPMDADGKPMDMQKLMEQMKKMRQQQQ